MTKKGIIFSGGWDGHTPTETSQIFKEELEKRDFQIEIATDWEKAKDYEYLANLDVIIPNWTQGEIDPQAKDNIVKAVASGVGMAGSHGGMDDAFRTDTMWQFVTGGQWVEHPKGNGIKYMVNIVNHTSPITEGIEDFEVISEQYYLHIDPAIDVLATTRFPNAPGFYTSNKPVDMPVIYTKMWGYGRVFYSSLGHEYMVWGASPASLETMIRGVEWAAAGPTRHGDLSKFEGSQVIRGNTIYEVNALGHWNRNKQ